MIPEFGITLGAILGLASFISILRGSPVLAAATAAMGIASFCVSNEVIKYKEEERLAKERAEQERQKIAYRKALEACREFEEFNRVYDYTIPRMELTYNCGSNQRFKISDEALQKKFAEQIDSIIERQEDARESLSDCCTFVTEVVVPNIDNINLRQNVQCKVRDVVSWITASNIRCRVYYKTPVRGGGTK